MKYLEDFVPGEVEALGDYALSQEEILEFGRRWDPQPFHTDPAAAAHSTFSGLVAAGTHIMAISVLLLVSHPPQVAILSGLGWEEVRFLGPARPCDVLTVSRECLEARPSASRPDCGVVRNRITLTNQRGQPVLSYVDAILVSRRPAGVADG